MEKQVDAPMRLEINVTRGFLMKTSFVRKKDASGSAMVKELPLGCFPCTFNSNVLFCSTGLHELDDLCGGGALVGGMFGVEQDEGLDLIGCFFFSKQEKLRNSSLELVGTLLCK